MLYVWRILYYWLEHQVIVHYRNGKIYSNASIFCSNVCAITSLWEVLKYPITIQSISRFSPAPYPRIFDIIAAIGRTLELLLWSHQERPIRVRCRIEHCSAVNIDKLHYWRLRIPNIHSTPVIFASICWREDNVPSSRQRVWRLNCCSNIYFSAWDEENCFVF